MGAAIDRRRFVIGQRLQAMPFKRLIAIDGVPVLRWTATRWAVGGPSQNIGEIGETVDRIIEKRIALVSERPMDAIIRAPNGHAIHVTGLLVDSPAQLDAVEHHLITLARLIHGVGCSVEWTDAEG